MLPNVARDPLRHTPRECFICLSIISMRNGFVKMVFAKSDTKKAARMRGFFDRDARGGEFTKNEPKNIDTLSWRKSLCELDGIATRTAVPATILLHGVPCVGCPGEMYVLQCRAAEQRLRLDHGERGGQVKVGQIGAIGQRFITKRANSLGDMQLGQLPAAQKGTVSDKDQGARQLNGLQLRAAGKGRGDDAPGGGLEHGRCEVFTFGSYKPVIQIQQALIFLGLQLVALKQRIRS